MPEGEPQQIHHVQLELGQALVVSVVTPDLGTRFPDLREEIRTAVRRSAEGMRFALSGNPDDRDAFLMDHGRRFEILGGRLHKAGIPAEMVFAEAFATLMVEPHGNVTPRFAKDLAGFFTDNLSYSPKEAA